MKKTAALFALIAMTSGPLGLWAQEPGGESAKAAARPPDHYYKLNLTIEETNDAGKIVNARTFVATVMTESATQSIRTGDRVPVAMGAESSGVWQYMDLGVDFDISGVRENGGNLCFRLVANVSSFATPLQSSSSGAQPSGGAASRPVVRQNKWDSGVLIPIGKPTVVFSADDLQNKGKMQVEVQATKLD